MTRDVITAETCPGCLCFLFITGDMMHVNYFYGHLCSGGSLQRWSTSESQTCVLHLRRNPATLH